MSEPVVSVRALTHRFGDVVALRNLELDVVPGVTGLVGTNGAGKTTLLRILLGLVHPTAGGTTVMGYDAGQAESLRARQARCDRVLRSEPFLTYWSRGRVFERTPSMRNETDHRLHDDF